VTNDNGPDALLAAAAALKIVRGSVDEEELAALLAGVVAVAGSADHDYEVPGHPSSAWMDRTRTMRGRRLMLPLGRGDSAWRNSLR
jgi:hypothetical protein